MPTTSSLRAGGYDDQKLGIGEKFYYVCGERVRGFCQRDTPNAKSTRRGVTLGERHRGCPQSENAGETRKIYLRTGG